MQMIKDLLAFYAIVAFGLAVAWFAAGIGG